MHACAVVLTEHCFGCRVCLLTSSCACGVSNLSYKAATHSANIFVMLLALKGRPASDAECMSNCAAARSSSQHEPASVGFKAERSAVHCRACTLQIKLVRRDAGVAAVNPQLDGAVLLQRPGCDHGDARVGRHCQYSIAVPIALCLPGFPPRNDLGHLQDAQTLCQESLICKVRVVTVSLPR